MNSFRSTLALKCNIDLGVKYSETWIDEFYIPLNERISSAFSGDELDALSRGQEVFFVSNFKYSGRFLIEYVAYSWLQLVRSEDEIIGIRFPLLEILRTSSLDREINFSSNVDERLNENCASSDTCVSLNVILSSVPELYDCVIKLLQLNNDLKSKSFIKELNALYNRLNDAYQSKTAPDFLILFFQCLVKFYIGDYKSTATIILSIRTPRGTVLGGIIDEFLLRISKFLEAGVTVENSKNKVLLVASSEAAIDTSEIDIIKFLKDIFVEHQIDIWIPDLDKIKEIGELIEYIGKLEPLDICFMGHGNSEKGISIVVSGEQRRLTMDDLSRLQTKTANAESFIVLACDAEFYEKFIISGDSKFILIHNVGNFSFQKMELFCAGFIRGRAQGKSVHECFDLGKLLLELRLNFSADVQLKMAKNEKADSLAMFF